MRTSIWSLILFGLAACPVMLCSSRAICQQTANVSLNTSTVLGIVPGTPYGINTGVWDGNLLDTKVPPLLVKAGINALRFPGGSMADIYHWQTNSTTSGTGAYINPADTFDAFMGVVQQSKASAIVTVNYGSNSKGTAGGDPNEAAAWVKYANVTKGYGVKYWEIGNELYGNGEYGSAWEEDLHSSHTPTTYGTNVVTFSNAMKKADPSIKVGVVLCAPGNWPDGQTPDWNSGVLAACGKKIDFVIVHWYPQGPGSESDSGLLQTTSQIAAMTSKLQSLITQYCGTNASNVEIFVTETNSVAYNPGKQSVSLVNALFLADNLTSWIEDGASNVDWWDLHNGIDTGNNNSSSLYGTAQYGDYGMFSSGESEGGISEPALDTPFPVYYGAQMLSYLGQPGDQLISTTSDQSLISAHAALQADGNLAVLLINKDPSNTYKVNLSLTGYNPAASAKTYIYGKTNTSIASGSLSGVKTSFIVSVKPYSLETIVMTGTTKVPVFVATGTASPTSVAPGGSVKLTAKVEDTGGALADGVVDLEVYDSSGNQVGQTYFTGQTFKADQIKSYTWKWTAPTTAGTYTFMIGVFGTNWTPDYYWNNSVATITVK